LAPSATRADAILDEIGRIFGVDLVLGGARESAIGLEVPKLIVIQPYVDGHEDGVLELIRILADAAAADVLQFHDPGQLRPVDAIGIVNHPVGIGERDRLGSQIEQLLDRVLGDISAAGDQANFVFERIFPGLQHLVGEIDAAVSGCFGTNQASRPKSSPCRSARR
jgi:hypothetical protein